MRGWEQAAPQNLALALVLVECVVGTPARSGTTDYVITMTKGAFQRKRRESSK